MFSFLYRIEKVCRFLRDADALESIHKLNIFLKDYTKKDEDLVKNSALVSISTELSSSKKQKKCCII
jgi:hypothetical protein